MAGYLGYRPNYDIISDNSIDSDQYVDASIDLAHMSVNSIDSDQYVDGSVDEAHIAADAVNFVTHLKAGTDGELITWDASGNPVAVAVGSSGQLLTSAGAGAPPTFTTVSGGENNFTSGTGVNNTGSLAVTDDTWTKLPWANENFDTDGDMDIATNERFTVGSGDGGIYLCTLQIIWSNPDDQADTRLAIYKNGTRAFASYDRTNGNVNQTLSFCHMIKLVATDYIEFYTMHDSAGNESLGSDTEYSFAGIHRIG